MNTPVISTRTKNIPISTTVENLIISSGAKNLVISTGGGALAAVAEKPASLPRFSPNRFLAATLFAAALICPTAIHAQGCAQCQDNTAATPPATQRAYRHAIILMVVAGGSFFLTTLVLFKRQP